MTNKLKQNPFFFVWLCVVKQDVCNNVVVMALIMSACFSGLDLDGPVPADVTVVAWSLTRHCLNDRRGPSHNAETSPHRQASHWNKKHCFD